MKTKEEILSMTKDQLMEFSKRYNPHRPEGSDCFKCSDCLHCTFCDYCFFCDCCYKCSRCSNCDTCTYCSDCSNCSDCSYCYSCSNCSCCKDARNLQWAIGNVELGEEEYKKKMKELSAE